MWDDADDDDDDDSEAGWQIFATDFREKSDESVEEEVEVEVEVTSGVVALAVVLFTFEEYRYLLLFSVVPASTEFGVKM